MNYLLKLFFISIMACFLQACLNTSAVSTTAQIALNRNSLKKFINDTQTTALAYQKIYVYNDKFKDTNVSFSTFNNEILLTGQIPSESERSEIEKLIKQIPGPDNVHNMTTLSRPATVLTQLGDSWITTKIKAKLIASNDLDQNRFKVITENGTVYLMGIVPHEEADAAIEIARNTDGVENVVKLFSYLTITKT